MYGFDLPIGSWFVKVKVLNDDVWELVKRGGVAGFSDGDAFDGAWVKGILEGWDLRRTASYANAVGALTATGLGAVVPIPRYEDALRLIREQDRVW